jgi:predicted amidohydrolase
MLVSDDKATNIQAARTAVEQAAKEGAQIISLPGTSLLHSQKPTRGDGIS